MRTALARRVDPLPGALVGFARLRDCSLYRRRQRRHGSLPRAARRRCGPAPWQKEKADAKRSAVSSAPSPASSSTTLKASPALTGATLTHVVVLVPEARCAVFIDVHGEVTVEALPVGE